MSDMCAMTAPVRLDDDVLQLILELIDRQRAPGDLLAAMMACKRMYEIGRRLLWKTLYMETRIGKNTVTRCPDSDAIHRGLCRLRDASRLAHLAALVKASSLHPPRLPLTRHVHVRLTFLLELTVDNGGITSPVDEYDMDDVIKDAAWNEFEQRMGVIVGVVAALVDAGREKPGSGLATFSLVVDVDLTTRDLRQWASFRSLLASLTAPFSLSSTTATSALVPAPIASLTITPQSSIPDPSLLHPAINTLGPYITRLHLSGPKPWDRPFVLPNLLSLVGPLTHLTLPGAACVGQACVSIIRDRHGPTLRRLECDMARTVDDESLVRDVLMRSPKLEVVSLAGSIRMWDRSKSPNYAGDASSKEGTRLRRVDVSRCVRLPKSFFDALARACPGLESLGASETCLDDGALAMICERCPRLRELDARYCEDLGGGALAALAAARGIRRVDLTSCARVVEGRDAAWRVTLLAEACGGLRELGLGPITIKCLSYLMWCAVYEAMREDGAEESVKQRVPTCPRYVKLDLTKLRGHKVIERVEWMMKGPMAKTETEILEELVL
ncbi:hypothetical protein HK101_006838 [Irineochytrium annulatum]|nr:hypothetical protein HK101_006838 [Irineochytrium annulatum]